MEFSASHGCSHAKAIDRIVGQLCVLWVPYDPRRGGLCHFRLSGPPRALIQSRHTLVVRGTPPVHPLRSEADGVVNPWIARQSHPPVDRLQRHRGSMSGGSRLPEVRSAVSILTPYSCAT